MLYHPILYIFTFLLLGEGDGYRWQAASHVVPYDHYGHRYGHHHSGAKPAGKKRHRIPSKYETMKQCWFNVKGHDVFF